MKQKRSLSVWVAWLIFAPSLYPALKIGINEAHEFLAKNRYDINHMDYIKDSYNYQGHLIQLQTEPTPKVPVDEREFPFVTPNREPNQNRFWRYVALFEVTSKDTDETKLAIAQRIQDHDGHLDDEDRFRIIWMEGDSLQTEEFSLSERRSPLYRTPMIRYVTPSPIEWVDNMLSGYPGYPSWYLLYVYPFATLAVSALYLIRFYVKQRKSHTRAG